jgi:hypothetical protein
MLTLLPLDSNSLPAISFLLFCFRYKNCGILSTRLVSHSLLMPDTWKGLLMPFRRLSRAGNKPMQRHGKNKRKLPATKNYSRSHYHVARFIGIDSISSGNGV